MDSLDLRAGPRALGTNSHEACAGDDLRLSDSRPSLVKPIETFTDIAAWTLAVGVGVTFGLDVGAPELGFANSLFVNVPAGTAYAEIRRSLFVNMNGKKKILGFWVKHDATFSRAALGVSVGGVTDFTKRYEGSVLYANHGLAEQWHFCAVPMGVLANTSGEGSDFSNVQTVRFQVFPTGANATRLQIGPIGIYEVEKSGVVVCFDDGNNAVNSVAYPKLAAKNKIASVAVSSAYVGTAGYLTLAQIQSLYANGWGMLNHTDTNLGMAGMTTANIITHIVNGHNYLVNNGMPLQARHLVLPGGSWDANVLNESSRRCDTSRLAGGQVFVSSRFENYHLLKPFYFTNGVTLAAAQAALTRLINYGGIAYMVFHNLVDVFVAAEDWRISDFNALIDWLDSQGVSFYLPGDVWPSRDIPTTSPLQRQPASNLIFSSADQRVLQSSLGSGGAGILLVSDAACFVYLGKTQQNFIPKYVELHVSVAGAGAQTAEVGFFSSPNPPNKGAQNLTKLVSTGTVGDLTTTGVKRNTAAFTVNVPAGTHLWAGIRTAMAVTQPTIWGLGPDLAQGQVLITPVSGALTGAGPWAGAIIGAAVTPVAPDLRGTLD